VPRAADEIGRLGVTLNAMLDRLGDALAHERRFVADASHELRTPLAILKAELELALYKDPGRAPRTREELERALASAADETDRLTQLAEDLLTLAQTDEGTLPVARREVELRAVLEGVAQRLERRAAAGERSIELHCEEGLVADVDPMRLEQAIGNLVDNSLRYGAGPIELIALRRGELLQIHVADRGPGLPEGFLGHAFERFTRVAHSSATGGAGLGLAIAASIAAAHGGRAQLANRHGGGADAWLELPVASYLKTPV
jgi:signal transduction histidine kinase